MIAFVIILKFYEMKKVYDVGRSSFYVDINNECQLLSLIKLIITKFLYLYL